MVANFGFKITFLNSFLCEKIDSFRKFLKNENFGHFPLKNTKNLWKFHKRRVRMHPPIWTTCTTFFEHQKHRFKRILLGWDWPRSVAYTVSQERLQPMSDGKRHFIVGSFLCYSYKLILISPGIFHRALFEKWLTLVAEKSPESAKFTYSNLEAFNVHPPSYVILILKKMPFFIILLYPLPDKSPHLAAENLWILWK